MSYLHSQSIAHRDLKPENILFVDKDHLFVKVVDFGLSKNFATGALQTVCGTPSYVAPEVIRGEEYTCRCDVWAIGVIAYLSLCGDLPFFCEDDNEDNDGLFDMILDGEYSFSNPVWSTVSRDAKNFVRNCLTLDPTQRPDSFDLLAHPWLASSQVLLDVNEAVRAQENVEFYTGMYGGSKGKTMG